MGDRPPTPLRTLWRDSAKEQKLPGGSGVFGMVLFLASVAMLFGAIVVGFIYIRLTTQSWTIPAGRGVPGILWLSTAVILLASVPLWLALLAARRDDTAGVSRNLLLALALDLLFLVGQSVAWVEILSGLSAEDRKTQYVFTFYMLTLTHAAHVVGGLVPLVFVSVRALRGAYNRARHAGVLYMNMYWHFLAAIWVVLFAVLLVFTAGE